MSMIAVDVRMLAVQSGPLVAHVSGSAKKLLLLHGGRGSHTHWAKNIEPLSRHFCIYALDLPGFGDAADVPGTIDAESYLALVDQGVNALIGEACVSVVGFSFGGAVAADLCRRLGSRCEKLALLGPGGFGEAKGRQLDLRPAPAAAPLDSRYRAVIRHNLLAMMLHDAKSVGEDTIDLQCANIAQARFNSLKVSQRSTLLGDIGAVHCPVLMIWGEKDVVAYPSPAGRAAQSKAARPDAGIAMVPDAGHWVQYEKPDAVNALLLEFLTTNR
jgi:2-hydroxy-6-oxonona-2,4-dienedioate hydrolase